MALKMTTREVDGVSVVALDGRIVLGEESNALREKIKALIAEGKKKVVLNMDNITFIDSAGLGELVVVHMWIRASGCSLKLAGVNPRVRELFELTNLLSVFDVYPTLDDALVSFHRQSAQPKRAAHAA